MLASLQYRSLSCWYTQRRSSYWREGGAMCVRCRRSAVTANGEGRHLVAERPNNQMQRTCQKVTHFACAKCAPFWHAADLSYMDLPDCQEPFLQFMALLRS